MALTYQLGISSADAITLYPEYDFKITSNKINSEMRTRSGKMYSYKWGEYKRFQFSLDFVSDANASIINSWYISGTELLFFITSDTATEVNSVVLMGKSSPISGFMKPYNNYRKGAVILETY